MHLYIHTKTFIICVYIFFPQILFFIFSPFCNYKSQEQKYLLGSASAEHSHQTDFL